MPENTGYTGFMSDTLAIHGKEYTSSKIAAEKSGYARDYIGQLSRGGLIDAQRVGGLWYVSMESLGEYQRNADIAAKSLPTVTPAADNPESLVTFEGRDYISASRASKLTGYNQDYVGQLARGSKIPSRQIGNRWYVDRDALVAHKAEKDALLAAVQSQAVGLPVTVKTESSPEITVNHAGPHLTYHSDERDLMPVLTRPDDFVPYAEVPTPFETRERSIPIRTVTSSTIPRAQVPERPLTLPTPRRNRGGKIAAGAVTALTIVVVLSYGLTQLSKGSVFAQNPDSSGESTSQSAAAAAAIEVLGNIGDVIEAFVSPEMRYTRLE